MIEYKQNESEGIDDEKIAIGLSLVLLLLSSIGCHAEEAPLYTIGENDVLDACFEFAYEQMTAFATTWNNEERAVDLYDQELADSYSEEDVKHPRRVLVLYPMDAFDPLYLFKRNQLEHSYITDSNVAWWALWNVNMINETGQSHLSVRYLSETMSLMNCIPLKGLPNTCYICFQLAEDSPCFITVLHPMGEENALINTTAIWINPGTTMSNEQVLVSTMFGKYGRDAFDIPLRPPRGEIRLEAIVFKYLHNKLALTS